MNYKIIFDRSFSSKKPDYGSRELVQAGDHITFLDENTFHSREVASVNGIIVTTVPFKNEKRFMFDRKQITKIERPIKEKKKDE